MPSISDQAQEVLNRIFSRTTVGIKLGLERMIAAAAAAGDPHLSRPAVHVAGTNGKGSICACLDAMLRKAGYRTGLYTSPHLVEFEERFLIDGKPVDTARWLEIYDSFEPIILKYDLTFFEAATLIAFELFRRSGVDWAIYETGLGGRLDATNILRPAVSVIGAIGLDHQEYLGSDILNIAAEKLGIAKPRTPLIMLKPDNPNVERFAQKYCRERDVPLQFAHVSSSGDQNPSGGESFQEGIQSHTITLRGKTIRLPLAGSFQRSNAMCAVLATKHIIAGEMDRAIEGIADAVLPGRFQSRIISGKQVIFDVAHNPMAAQALVSTLLDRFGENSIRFVVGIMKDKDAADMLAAYSRVAAEIIYTRPQTQRALTTDELIGLHKRYCLCIHSALESVHDATRAAISRGDDMPICITGSFYTVGESMKALSISPYSC